MRLHLGLIVIALGLFPTVTSLAATFSGRLTASSYLWQHTEFDSSETRHTQNTATLGLRLARVAGHDLEFATSMRGRYDIRDRGDNVDDYRVHELYARWRNIANRVDFTGGRHRVNTANGSASIDGASLSVRVLRHWQLGGFLGSLAPPDGHFHVTEFEKGHALNVRIGHSGPAIGTLNVFLAERRKARSYPGIELNTLASRNLGIDWRRGITDFGSVYGHLRYDHLRRQVGRGQLNLRWNATRSMSIQGEYYYRRPSIAYNSIFWVFGESEYAEGRLRLNLSVAPSWSASAGFALIDVSGDDGQRFDFGISHKHISVMLHGKSGVPGNTFGVSGNLSYPLNERWTVRGGSNYATYELFEEQPESNTEASVWGGLSWQTLPQATIDLEAQLLSHDLATSTDLADDETDFRILARFSWWFFERLGHRGEVL